MLDKRQILLTFSALTLSSLIGCGPSMQPEEQPASQLHFIENWPQSPSCGFRRALDPVVNVCVRSSASAEATEKQKALTLQALQSWLGAVRQVNQQVTNNVQFACTGNALTLNIQSGDGTATGGPGKINVYPTKNLGSHLHEWGHAFACLGDTYVNGAAGRCKPGHQESIMCWGAYGENRLYGDDIAGVQTSFLRHFQANPGNGAATVPTAATKELYVALSSDAAPRLLVSADKSVSSVAICASRAAVACRANTPGAIVLTRVATAPTTTRAIFMSPQGLVLNAGATLVITANGSDGLPITSRMIGFKQRN